MPSLIGNNFQRVHHTNMKTFMEFNILDMQQWGLVVFVFQGNFNGSYFRSRTF